MALRWTPHVLHELSDIEEENEEQEEDDWYEQDMSLCSVLDGSDWCDMSICSVITSLIYVPAGGDIEEEDLNELAWAPQGTSTPREGLTGVEGWGSADFVFGEGFRWFG